MGILTDTGRRPQAVHGPAVTNVKRQTRPADPDLQQLERRIAALESAGDEHGQGWQVALLRRRYSHLWRDRHVAGAGWYTDAANLLNSIERAEMAR